MQRRTIPAYIRGACSWCPLPYKREELAAVGVRILLKDYQKTMLKGILEELAKYVSSIRLTMCITHTHVDTRSLIDYICEEANRLKNCWAVLY